MPCARLRECYARVRGNISASYVAALWRCAARHATLRQRYTRAIRARYHYTCRHDIFAMPLRLSLRVRHTPVAAIAADTMLLLPLIFATLIIIFR